MTRTIALVGAALAVAGSVAAQQQSAMGGMATRGSTFRVRVENVSTDKTLKLSNGQTAPAPTAPVLWAVHGGTDLLFVDGMADRGLGLESLAEDGNPEPLVKALMSRPGVAAAGAVAVPQGDMGPGPILPGKAYEFTFTAEPGQKLTVAFMFGQSNDLFYAPDGRGLALFDALGAPLNGDVTATLVLWDAGTEVNQEPGLGSEQAPRQKQANTGTAERGVVRPVQDRYTYPRTDDVVRVTVTPVPTGMAGH